MYACFVLQKCCVDYGSDTEDMERRLMKLDGGSDPAIGEESQRAVLPIASRKEEPFDRPEPTELVDSPTLIPEVGVPHGASFPRKYLRGNPSD